MTFEILQVAKSGTELISFHIQYFFKKHWVFAN